MTNDNRKASTVWDEVDWTAPSILSHDRIDDAVAHLVTYFADFPGYTGPGYTGALFNELGGGGDRPEVAYTFTYDDIFAVSTLSVNLDTFDALQLTGSVINAGEEDRTAIEEGKAWNKRASSVPIDIHEVRRLLAGLPLDLDLVRATDDHLDDADRLWREIRRYDLGPTRVSKLLARKRPKLCPVIDTYIKKQLRHSEGRVDFFKSLRRVLRDKTLALPDHLRDIRAKAMAGTTSPNAADLINREELVPGLHAEERIRKLSTLRVFDIVLWKEEEARQEINKKKPQLKEGVMLAAQR